MDGKISLYGVKAIVLDLGGVILNIEPDNTIQAFKQLISDDFADVYEQLLEKEVFLAFERGDITAKEFRKQLRELSGKANIPESAIDSAWNAMIADIPEQRVNFLLELKKKHRTFLLSNTNEIHCQRYNEDLIREHGLPGGLSDCFEKVYYSHQLRMRKPDKAIFRHVLNEIGTEARETLFIDDYLENVQAAEKLGYLTYWFQEGDELGKVFGSVD